MLKVLKNAAPEIKDCKILTLIKYSGTFKSPGPR